MKKTRALGILLTVVMVACLLFGGTARAYAAGTEVESTLTLATTTSTYDSGLLDYLLPIFENKYNTKVKVLSLGTGQAIATAKNGDADVILVHARSQEDAFVSEGYGVNRRNVMHNQFLIVGPASDPAGIKGEAKASEALKKIAAKEAKFISRGDKSGTHTKELSIWKSAGITPSGSWYVEAGQGMGDTLMMANQMKAYTITDEATYLAMQNKFSLVHICEGDGILLNPYGIIAVSKMKYPNIHYNAAMALVDFTTSYEGQKLIYEFGRDRYGQSLFIPDAFPLSSFTALVPTAAPAAAVSTTGTVSVRTVLNVRSGPGTGYRVLGTLQNGTAVTILGTSGQWCRIAYKGGTAYVHAAYIKK